MVEISASSSILVGVIVECDNHLSDVTIIYAVDITVSITQYGNNTAGASFNLECSATVNGSNDQIDITWLSTFDSEVPFEIVNTTDNSSTLTFNPLFTSHAGTYTCRVRLGGIEKRRYFTLVVEGNY